MSHHHDHHDHTHTHAASEMSFDERLVKLLDHWVKHNDDHADSYRRWAGTAKSHHLEGVSALLEEAAEMTQQISDLFERATKAVTED